MKKITISFIFLVTTICFAGDYSSCNQPLYDYDIEKLTNSTIPVFVGTNQFNIPFYEFIEFMKEHFDKIESPGMEKYVTNSFPTNFSLNDFAWEPDDKLKQLWGDYYDSSEKTNDSSDETFNGIPIIKGGPAKEAILDCIISENSSNSPIEHRLTILDHKGQRYDYENLVTNFMGEYSKYNFVQSTTNILINEFFESRLNDLTWYYENFDGYVNVNFEVVGYGFSNAIKQELEKEIREAIQKIINLHFPKENP